MALADGLDLGTGQFDAGLIFSSNEVVVVGFAVLATILIPSPRSGAPPSGCMPYSPSPSQGPLSITHLRKKHKRKPLMHDRRGRAISEGRTEMDLLDLHSPDRTGSSPKSIRVVFSMSPFSSG